MSCPAATVHPDFKALTGVREVKDPSLTTTDSIFRPDSQSHYQQ